MWARVSNSYSNMRWKLWHDLFWGNIKIASLHTCNSIFVVVVDAMVLQYNVWDGCCVKHTDLSGFLWCCMFWCYFSQSNMFWSNTLCMVSMVGVECLQRNMW